MNSISFLIVSAAVTLTWADQSAVELVQSIFSDCLQNFRISGCVMPKSLAWTNQVAERNVIKITEDLALIKKYNPEVEEDRGLQKDILDKFEDFLQTHDLVAKTPALLRPNGPFGMFVPRNFQPSDVTVPLAATGRSSKIVKRVIFPFLLGLKFNTAVLVPLALTLIALKTWKALTLGLLSLVLSGAIAIFTKFVSPKVPAYEVVHYPHQVEHIDYHHVDVLPAPAVPALHYGQPVYTGREFDGQEIAYSSYMN